MSAIRPLACSFVLFMVLAFQNPSRAGMPENYVYSSVGKRDPFRSEFRRKVIRRPGPLERFDLNQLKDASHPWATLWRLGESKQ